LLCSTYPTQYIQYGTAFIASGVPLTDGSCAERQTYTLSQHPPLPQPTPPPRQEGMYGVGYHFGNSQEDPNDFFEQQFSLEVPFQQCTPLLAVSTSGKPAGPSYVTAVQFLTVTSTSRTTGSSTVAQSTESNPTTTANPTSNVRGNHFSSGSSTNAAVDTNDNTPTSKAVTTTANSPSSPNASVTNTPSATAPIVVGTNTLSPITSSSVVQFVVSSQTLAVGSTITIGSGSSQTTIALTTDGTGNTVLNVGGQPSTISNSPTTANPVVVGSVTLSPAAVPAATASSPVYVVSGNTLSIGGSVTVGTGAAQTIVALSTNQAGNTVLNVGGQTSTLSNSPNTVAPVVAGSITLTPASSSPTSPQFIVSGQILSVEGSITLGSGASQTIIVLTTNAAGATVLNAGGQLSTLASQQATSAPLVVAGTTLSPVAGSSGVFSIAGTTLSVGGSATLGIGSPSTTVLALSTDNAGHTVLVSNGQSSTLSAPSVTPAPSLVLFGTSITANSPSSANQGFIVSGQTLTVGGTVILGSGASATTLALQTDTAGHTVLVSNGVSSTISASITTAAPVIIGGQTITPEGSLSASANGFVVDGQTLTVGGSITIGSGVSATTLALQTDSAGNTVVVSNGVSSTISVAATGRAPLVIGGQTITAAATLPTSAAGFVVAGQTLTVGGSITIGSGSSATTLALQTDFAGHTIIVSNGHSSQLGTLTAGLAPLTIDGQTLGATTLSNGIVGFVVAGQTLTLGGAIEIGTGSSATVLALVTDSAGHTLIVSNGHTSEIPTTTTPSIVIAGQTIEATALPSGGSGFVVAGQTLSEGGSITVSGTLFTLTTDAAGHTVLVSNAHSSMIPNQVNASPLTIEGQTITPTNLPYGMGQGYIIDGQTLTPGGSVTISGTTFTLTVDPEGNTVLVNNGKTSTVPTSSMALTTSGMASVASSRPVEATATATSLTTKKSAAFREFEPLETLSISCVVLIVVGILFGSLG
jgi:hypothetical protein